MSFVPTTAATTVAAAAAAEKKRRALRKEEESMTGYTGEDLEGWEFKIVRANTRKFRDPAVVRRLCEEEGRAGWEMLEKFDDCRIRFKRRVEHRDQDPYREIDPYRTLVGISAGKMELTIAGIVLGGIVLLGLVAFLLVHLFR
jgi:hypothetical protein